MKKTTTILLASSLALLSAANAAVISAVGNGTDYDITGIEAQSYRSTNVAKSFDADGDNAYGTLGYLVFGGDNTQHNSEEFSTGTNWVSSNPSFVTTIAANDAATVTHRNANYDASAYDDATLAIGADVADFGNGAILLMNTSTTNGDWYELLTFDVDTTVTTFRLGIMSGQDNDATGKFDPSGFRVSFAGGAATEVTGVAATTDTIGMVFFDVTTDGTAGTFSIEGQRSTSHPSLAGVTFDAVPEPSSSAMLLCGFGSLLLLRRKS
ncbi:PEP-CTERM sorting domain-containing protein [Rubritalea sp.]|uniref:PEP-CTERM sorting domain-containing protein n=1 Tax=Rubritalea sp. TaxID=2109375 RepID=UPI003EF282F0